MEQYTKNRIASMSLIAILLSFMAQTVLAEVQPEESSGPAEQVVVPCNKRITPMGAAGGENDRSRHQVMALVAGSQRTHKSELELNWKYLLGTGTYNYQDSDHSISANGVMLEINPGIKLIAAPGLDFGVAAGFLVLPVSVSFDYYNESAARTEQWEATAISVGTFAMMKYSYDFNIDWLEIGVENGVGLGYIINYNEWQWKDPADADANGSGSDEQQGWTPMVDVGLKVNIPVSEISRLGLKLGGLLAPLQAGDYINVGTIMLGLNYQVEF